MNPLGAVATGEAEEQDYQSDPEALTDHELTLAIAELVQRHGRPRDPTAHLPTYNV